MKFPYGIADFHKLITDGYFFVDRTAKLRTIEELGEQLLFLRPRRFGKSLLLAMMENYYDIQRADEFEQLFGHLAIGQNPTPLRNSYLVMRWDFSVVNSVGAPEAIQRSLYAHINRWIDTFTHQYRPLLSREIPLDPVDATVSLAAAVDVVRESGQRLYLLLDEYDNFANEVLMAGGRVNQQRYEALVYGDGVLKTVFKNIKSAGAGRGLDRVFITGVSPVVLTDSTSGYNVAKQISLQPELADLCGFREEEVAGTLHQIARQCAIPSEQADEALHLMRSFYNGYSFVSPSGDAIYNPTLALYYFDHFQRNCCPPARMLDGNFATDRNKIAYVAGLPNGGKVVLDAVQEETGVAIAQLEDRFGVREMTSPTPDRTFMASLLYYLGVLTLTSSTPLGEQRLIIPNLVVRRLYVERIQELLLPDGGDRDAGWAAARHFFLTGDLQPLCAFIESRYFRALDNRDYVTANELTLKTAFLTLIFHDIIYIVDSETAVGRGYSDLTLIRRPERWHQPELWDFLLEFKLIKLSDLGLTGEEVERLSQEQAAALPLVQQSFAAAAAQLARYREALTAQYGAGLRLRTYAVIGLGFERLVWVETAAGG